MSKSKRRWVAHVQSTSNAMDLEPEVFKKKSAKAIAQSILRSVKTSRRKKGTTLSSGISMMTYYVNRAGSKLSPTRKRTIQAAKEEYRKLVGRRKKPAK
jgi:hypothetical protein